jgi:CheY-specific phosphatase CheX
MLPTVAANMLGDDDAPAPAQQLDALGEIANVICGNLLPHIAAPHAVFQLDAPQLLDTTDMALSQPKGNVVEAQLGLDHGRVDLRLQVETAAASDLEEL